MRITVGREVQRPVTLSSRSLESNQDALGTPCTKSGVTSAADVLWRHARGADHHHRSSTVRDQI